MFYFTFWNRNWWLFCRKIKAAILGLSLLLFYCRYHCFITLLLSLFIVAFVQNWFAPYTAWFSSFGPAFAGALAGDTRSMDLKRKGSYKWFISAGIHLFIYLWSFLLITCCGKLFLRVWFLPLVQHIAKDNYLTCNLAILQEPYRTHVQRCECTNIL